MLRLAFPARLTAALLTGTVLASATPAFAQSATAARSFSVPAGPASTTVQKFARQAGLQILMLSDAAQGVTTNAVSGTLTPQDGLEILISGTGLRVADWRDGVVTLGRQHSRPASNDGDGRDARNVGSETIVVTGIADPFRSKENSTTIVETVVYDDVETLTADGSIAGLLTQLPGISTVEDGEYPRYVTVRGISADLNHTTIDGVTLATVGENGSGTRRVNLQLIPSDLSRRVDLFKTFTAEQDAGAIGGAINIVTRSAFDKGQEGLFLDVFSLYRTREGEGGSNSVGNPRKHWGYGVKGNYGVRFGSDNQFGLVLSGRYDSTPRNFAQNWQNTKRYFTDGNVNIPRPDPELGWNGRALPGNFGYGTYADVSESYGGSAKFEYRAPDDAIHASLIAYDYVRIQDQTANLNYIDTAAWVANQTPGGGRMRVSQLVENVRHNQYRRENRGILGNASFNFDNSRLVARAGLTEETFKDWEPYVSIVSNPAGEYLTYRMNGDGIPVLGELENPDILRTAPYRMNAQRQHWTRARQTAFDARLDWSSNVEPGSEGLGYVVGAEWRRLDMKKDIERIDYRATGNVSDYMYISGYRPPDSPYSLAWLDFARYRKEKWDTFPVNETASRHNSLASDYGYKEDLATGYVSLHYNLPSTTIVAGVRYDKTTFDADTPIITNGSATGAFTRNKGGYEHFLPSLNVVHRIDDTNIRLSWSETLGRPTPGNIATAESTSCDEGDGGSLTCTMTRGNPDLKPRRSRNLDATVEHYYAGRNGMVLLGYFYKKIRDDIFTLREETVINGVPYVVRQPRNASESSMHGVEFAWVHRGLPVGIADHEVDLSFNVVRMWGKMDYVTDTATRGIDRLVDQPKWIGNASVTYRVPAIGGGIRVNANYRDRFLSSIGANPWQDQGAGALTTVNLAAWHDVTDNLLFKYEWNNVFDNQPHFRVGENDEWVRQVNDYGSALFFHAIMKF